MNTIENSTRPRILVLGASGLTGGAVAAILDTAASSIEVVRASRRQEKVDSWSRGGKQAVYLDLDDARTFSAALRGIDRLYLLTGYTFAMIHQSKTLVDAAADAGVRFVVHQGVFGNNRSTDPHFAWHEMVERYIEGSGIHWSHLHPHFFMENLLTTVPVRNSQVPWPMGEKRVGWVAGEDLAAVAAKVLEEGGDRHAGKNYYLSTDVLNGTEAAEILSEATGHQFTAAVMTPVQLMALLASGAVVPNPDVEAYYAKSQLEWVQQTYDGRMDYSAVSTPAVSELLGRPAVTLREWAIRNREALLRMAAS
ncbi:NmrA family NAD(P)-binding protein [Caballeronia sp. KNU42]